MRRCNGFLRVLDELVRSRVADLHVEPGRTQGRNFYLFTYLTFSRTDATEIDPVVVGLTFARADNGRGRNWSSSTLTSAANPRAMGSRRSPGERFPRFGRSCFVQHASWRGNCLAMVSGSLKPCLIPREEPEFDMEATRQEPQSPRSLSIEEKRQFILSTLPKMAEHTFPFLCSVIGIQNAKTGRHIGSALRCILQGKRAILTAEHVIREAQNEPAGFAISAGYGRPPFVVHGPVNIDPVADLAVYFLPQDYPDDSRCRLLADGSVRTANERGLRRIICSCTDFPVIRVTRTRRKYFQGVVNRSLPYGAMQRIDNLPDDLTPIQFAIEYDPAGMTDPCWRCANSGRSARSEWQSGLADRRERPLRAPVAA